jgi:hypothetical protein
MQKNTTLVYDHTNIYTHTYLHTYILRSLNAKDLPDACMYLTCL